MDESLALTTSCIPTSRVGIFFFLMVRRAPRFTLFPYTTLFRSTTNRNFPPAGLGASQQQVCHVHAGDQDRKSTRLISSHRCISYAVFCLKKKNNKTDNIRDRAHRQLDIAVHPRVAHQITGGPST